jgi:hypothetical protein
MIIDRILALIAFLGLAVFMIIPATRIPTPDIIAIVVLCLALAGVDFFLALRKRDRD